ncbi:unnamed protein product [Adineta steineri]|uniref:G-protein coupled receptors family 1 profile domain-containing protein n=1 Tax=Adineta steineri TaxID=433720 RepID=A0A818QIM5_9BILA|nr:unnamed protein product [Adineta steineri]CAF1412548.1 unnamed protein product [Adineta steineri]CAF1521060.1 unnamed protein product [Adineta steineri]CAF1650312.1 unnamed protein product [Adineta steineri]CAF3640801.1 unnamed protein product [Adineta steineri]
MLTANSYLTAVVFGSSILSIFIYALENDLKQIQYQDALCVVRTYIGYASCALLNFSFLLQALYRYIIVVYPSRLFWQSARCQMLAICLTWIFSFVCPFEFLFNGEIIYNSDNQMCVLPLQLSFSVIYYLSCAYVIPIVLLMFIYFKLVKYVKGMSNRVTSVNTLSRARRELKMVRRLVILVTIVIAICFPYTIFTLMSFFNHAPKYLFRIAFMFVGTSLLSVIIVLFQFTDPLKASVITRIKPKPNIVATIIV